MCVLQATYYIPSANQSTPYGKLYFKAVNILNKRKALGVPSGRAAKREKNCMRYDLGNLDSIASGKAQKVTILPIL